ncbi:hypothetical protein [Flavobacterium difficile]|uniref:DUF922 domain-containing protein n=1 Tax=Flavobacterium difficile TaxID=2709659 RepID=A0ABX0I638_9FLAO|nr:hypothetical protein [Flavobacterium difficile]NHM01565.1 hypothetical protein [Flavobacterium difficile]
MQLLKLSTFIIFIYSIFSFEKVKCNDDDQILWKSERKLVWDDFKGIADTSMINVEAITSYKIEVTDAYFENDIPKYQLSCYFIKSKSWTITNEKKTLDHEQLHFDIAEIYARKIRKAFDSLNFKKCVDTNKYDEIYYRLGDECEIYQDKYDNSVYFNEVQQKKWSIKVNAELERLKKYAYEPNE